MCTKWLEIAHCSVTVYHPFFLLHAAKVRSSCEEGPGQSALQSAYHNPQLDETELKQNRTTLSFRPKIANKQINKLADAVGGKSRWGQNWCKARIGRTDSEQGALPVTESSQPGRACSEEPVGQESQARKVQLKRRAPWTQ